MLKSLMPFIGAVVLTAAISTGKDKEIPFSTLDPVANAITKHVNDQFDLAVKEEANRSGGIPGFKYHVVAKGALNYLDSSPRTTTADGKDVPACAFYIRVRARAKCDIDVATNPVKLGAVETVQTHALLVIPRLRDGRVQLSYDVIELGRQNTRERKATQEWADAFGKNIAEQVTKKIKERATTVFKLPDEINAVTDYVGLVVTKTGITLRVGGTGDGYAEKRFSTEDARLPGATPGVTWPDDLLLEEGIIQVYNDTEFRDIGAQFHIGKMQPGECWDPPSAIKDRASSIRWRLPADVIVRLVQDGNCKGKQVCLIGEGQIRALSDYDFNDCLSRLRREQVGPCSDNAPNTVILYNDSKFRGSSVTVNASNQSAFAPVVIAALRGKVGDNDASSVKWDLAPGVMVFVTQDADGRGRNYVLTGRGEQPHLDDVGLNDKVSALVIIP